MQRLIVVLFTKLVFISTASASGNNNLMNLNDTSRSDCMNNAYRLLDEAFVFMQKHYYRKDFIQWDSLLNNARQRLCYSNSCEDAYETITWCIKQLNEPHSFLMPASKAAIYNADTNFVKQKPLLSELAGEMKGEMLEPGVAYITVPWVSTTDSLTCQRVADSIQQIIAGLDNRGVSKWIIDLRKNTGGNCWPMLAGIGPLLGEGVCGYFINGGEQIPITYTNGTAMQGRYVRCRVSTGGYQLKPGRKNIVILTGKRTSSSGEIIALAFKGKEGVYFYGEPTAGYTTANATYTLSDNSMLVLTVCKEADRTGRICDGRIMPDEIIYNGMHGDPAKDAALMYLISMNK
jgi:carboxyl-terminal processing protease